MKSTSGRTSRRVRSIKLSRRVRERILIHVTESPASVGADPQRQTSRRLSEGGLFRRRRAALARIAAQLRTCIWISRASCTSRRGFSKAQRRRSAGRFRPPQRRHADFLVEASKASVPVLRSAQRGDGCRAIGERSSGNCCGGENQGELRALMMSSGCSIGIKCEHSGKNTSRAFGMRDARSGSVADAERSNFSRVISLPERMIVVAV